MRGYFNTPYQDDGTFTFAPAGVLGLAAIVISGSEVDLNWSDAAGANGYNVFRNGVLIGFSSPSLLNDTGVSPGVTYTYTVAATNSHGNGPISNSVTVTTAPAQVTGLVAIARSASQIDLTWNSVVGATSYSIKRNGVVVHPGNIGTAYSDTGLTASTTYTYNVFAVGIGGNGADSAPAQATTSSAGGNQFKFATGHWIFLDSGQSLDTQYAQLDTVGAKKNAGFNISGACVRMDWASMEGNTAGDYSAGFAQWDRFIAKASSYGLDIGFHFNYQKYNKATTSFPGYFPTYLSGAAYGPTSNDGTNFFYGGVWTCANNTSNGGFTQCAMLWNSVGGQFPVRDRVVAMLNAYGARYDATNSNLKLFTVLGEEPPVISGYTDAKHLTICTGANGIFPKGATAFPTTVLRIMNNYGQNDGGLLSIMNAAIASNWACGGGPDTCNETGETTPSGTATPNPRIFNADQIYRNVRSNGTGASYVGKYWWIAEIENPEQGPANSAATRPAQFGSGFNIDMLHHCNLQGATLALWAWNGFTGPNDNRTVTNPANTHPDLWDFLKVNPLTNTTYPTNVP